MPRTTCGIPTLSLVTNQMSVLRSIVFAAVAAGVIVGAVVTAIQQFSTVPLILKAEVYERQAHAAAQSGVGGDHSAYEHKAVAWEPSNGLERNFYTAMANRMFAIAV